MKIMKFFIMLLSIVALGSCSNELVEMDSVESATLSTSLEENVIIDSVSVEEDSVRVYHVSKSDFPIAITSNGIITNVKTPRGIQGPFTIPAGQGTLKKLQTEKIRLIPATVNGTRLTAGIYPCDVYEYAFTVSIPKGASVKWDEGSSPCGYDNYYSQELGAVVEVHDTYAILKYYSLLVNYNLLGQYIGEFVFPIDLRKTVFTYYIW